MGNLFALIFLIIFNFIVPILSNDILFLADGQYYSHYVLAPIFYSIFLNLKKVVFADKGREHRLRDRMKYSIRTYKLAIILKENGKHVTFLIANYGNNPKIEPNNASDLNINEEIEQLNNQGINAIKVEMDHRFEGTFSANLGGHNLPSNWEEEQISTDLPLYWTLTKCRTVTFYQGSLILKLLWPRENPSPMDLDNSAGLHFWSFFHKNILVQGLTLCKTPTSNAVIRNESLLEYLRSMQFSLGIAEIGSITSGFALFYELGIANTIATSATPAIPAFYHFLGLGIPIEVPGNKPILSKIICFDKVIILNQHYSAQKGDGLKGAEILKHGSNRQRQNKVNILNLIENFQNIYSTEYNEIYVYAQQWYKGINNLKQIPPLTQLFANVRYFLVNHSNIVAYKRPNLSKQLNEKVGYIGGVAIGDEMLKTYKRKVLTRASINVVHNTTRKTLKLFLKKKDCLGFLSIGTLATFNRINREKLIVMFETFAKHSQCDFLVRIPSDLLSTDGVNIPENVTIIEEYIQQRKILAQRNTKIAIIHCGQNSLTEALYAGVPVICIPLLGDQRYNASVVEYKNVGIWVSAKDFHLQFDKAMEDILTSECPHFFGCFCNGRNKYEKNVQKLAKQLHKQEAKPKEIFLSAVQNAIESNIPYDHSIHPGEINFKKTIFKCKETEKYNLLCALYPSLYIITSVRQMSISNTNTSNLRIFCVQYQYLLVYKCWLMFGKFK
ncbi:hypothetical protein Mgra_00004808 [Meloidogyne graminicola]|uniref:glucuronosyltransferase n=1 Tax=Meloidogyne graminicola TaxID=189291 RepID=A0A8S9ZR10_9BILA|nr:hypothetical protein Mgra_00004808 [Meloidogyne graminicola]